MSWWSLIRRAWELFQALLAKLRQQEQDAYAEHLKDIADADAARPVGSMLDDPNNRDNAGS